MSCNSCKNYNGQLCLWPSVSNHCHDCIRDNDEIRKWQVEKRRECATNYWHGLREVDCPECPQRKKCQKENHWHGDRIETRYELEELEFRKMDIDSWDYYRADITVTKRDDGKFDVTIHGRVTFHFVTDGEFIKTNRDLNMEAFSE